LRHTFVPRIRYLGFTTRGKKGPLTTTGDLSACMSKRTLIQLLTVNNLPTSRCCPLPNARVLQFVTVVFRLLQLNSRWILAGEGSSNILLADWTCPLPIHRPPLKVLPRFECCCCVSYFPAHPHLPKLAFGFSAGYNPSAWGPELVRQEVPWVF
jgi:hypothetical protein